MYHIMENGHCLDKANDLDSAINLYIDIVLARKLLNQDWLDIGVYVWSDYRRAYLSVNV